MNIYFTNVHILRGAMFCCGLSSLHYFLLFLKEELFVHRGLSEIVCVGEVRFYDVTTPSIPFS